jgi:hypothetical protein
MLKHIVVTTLLVAALATTARADSNDDRLKKLHELYQCPIFSYLQAIKRATPKTEQDSFLIVEMSYPNDGRFYAQCAFFDDWTQLHCEAASPHYDKRLKAYFTPQRRQVLDMLGYTTRSSKNNFYVELPASDDQSLYGVAGLIVETVGRVFDMQLDERLIYHAPLVTQMPRGSDGDKFCAPMVSVR